MCLAACFETPPAPRPAPPGRWQAGERPRAGSPLTARGHSAPTRARFVINRHLLLSALTPCSKDNATGLVTRLSLLWVSCLSDPAVFAMCRSPGLTLWKPGGEGEFAEMRPTPIVCCANAHHTRRLMKRDKPSYPSTRHSKPDNGGDRLAGPPSSHFEMQSSKGALFCSRGL